MGVGIQRPAVDTLVQLEVSFVIMHAFGFKCVANTVRANIFGFINCENNPFL